MAKHVGQNVRTVFHCVIIANFLANFFSENVFVFDARLGSMYIHAYTLMKYENYVMKYCNTWKFSLGFKLCNDKIYLHTSKLKSFFHISKL